MTAVEKHVAAMNAANALTDTAGVRQKGGKKYLEVKHRITVLRQTYGLEIGIDTELLHADDKYVRVGAKITDAAGRVIGSGLAEELRGSSGVTTTSAIEVCETSAIGRAASSVGLHGGEYASLNEVEIARSHEQHLPSQETTRPVPTMTVADTIPFDDSDTRQEKNWVEWSAVETLDLQKMTTQSALNGWLNDNQKTLVELGEKEPTIYQDIAATWTRLTEIAKQNQQRN